jgi:hypothetical protein
MTPSGIKVDVVYLFTSLQFFVFKEILFRYTPLLFTILAKVSLYDIRLEAFTEINLIKSSTSDSRVRWFKHTKVTGSNNVCITDRCKRSE